MKKISTTIVACALTLAVPTMSALAAGASENLLIAPHHESRSAVQPKEIKLQAKVINKVDMVPARAVFEALGFTVTWNAKEKKLHAENGERETDVVLGDDNYFAYSTKSEGMTAPVPLGAAPVKIGGSIYVPVKLFSIVLGNQANPVVVKGGKIIVNSGSKMENTQLPTPFVNYDSIDAARKAAGANFAVPTELPENYKQDEIFVFNSRMAQIIYRNGEQTLYYRVSQETGDISGDYNVYESTKTVAIGNLEVTLKGNKGLVSVASWEADGFNYCLLANKALTAEQVQNIILSITIL
ncbi:stalk domain-containing protein [Paenibacillus sp. HW567]|uniref:stalk domain-containing protein n=1 Tax=Paenibacillus sp. HW567 TaxID=1034769 RepID=UPI0003738B45|nr:stalk domain-containing protein [Paenibacillus sp. HW567]